METEGQILTKRVWRCNQDFMVKGYGRDEI